MCSLVVRFGLQRDALRYEVAAVGSGAERIKPRKVTGEIKLGCSSIRDSPGKEFCESRISRNPRSQVRIPLPGPRGAEENSKSHSLSGQALRLRPSFPLCGLGRAAQDDRRIEIFC